MLFLKKIEQIKESILTRILHCSNGTQTISVYACVHPQIKLLVYEYFTSNSWKTTQTVGTKALVAACLPHAQY
jgi:hypothetical protein